LMVKNFFEFRQSARKGMQRKDLWGLDICKIF